MSPALSFPSRNVLLRIRVLSLSLRSKLKVEALWSSREVSSQKKQLCLTSVSVLLLGSFFLLSLCLPSLSPVFRFCVLSSFSTLNWFLHNLCHLARFTRNNCDRFSSSKASIDNGVSKGMQPSSWNLWTVRHNESYYESASFCVESKGHRNLSDESLWHNTHLFQSTWDTISDLLFSISLSF